MYMSHSQVAAARAHPRGQGLVVAGNVAYGPGCSLLLGRVPRLQLGLQRGQRVPAHTSCQCCCWQFAAWCEWVFAVQPHACTASRLQMARQRCCSCYFPPCSWACCRASTCLHTQAARLADCLAAARRLVHAAVDALASEPASTWLCRCQDPHQHSANLSIDLSGMRSPGQLCAQWLHSACDMQQAPARL